MRELPPRYELRLYIKGDQPASKAVRASVEAVCQKHLAQRHQLEVIDVDADPKRALQGNVVSTPTLIKISPPPVRKLVGDFVDPDTIVRGLGLDQSHDGA
jgi:circadian clock protein KaiB